MQNLHDKRVLVLGLGPEGLAACRLLRKKHAEVTAVTRSTSPALRRRLPPLQRSGVRVHLDPAAPLGNRFDVAVVSPEITRAAAEVRALAGRDLPLLGTLELGYQQTLCLIIAVAGTNGKGTLAKLIQQVLEQNDRRTAVAGTSYHPICAVAPKTKDLDFLTLQVTPAELDQAEFFRPAIAIISNLFFDDPANYPNAAAHTQAMARLFQNQQAFDWTIIQKEALDLIRAEGLPVPGKVITFSARQREADLHLERGLLISRMPGWAGPLLDMDHCQIRGPHVAENFMAVLALGRVLRLPLEQMAELLKGFPGRPHCCQPAGELRGVRFIDDASSTNPESLEGALLAAPPGRGQNVCLIAGGADPGFDFHALGPVVAARVKHAFLLGTNREKIRAAWSLFTPCTLVDSLLEAVQKAAEKSFSGDVILFSPASRCSEMFRNVHHRGDVYRQAIAQWSRSISSGSRDGATTASPPSSAHPAESDDSFPPFKPVPNQPSQKLS